MSAPTWYERAQHAPGAATSIASAALPEHAIAAPALHAHDRSKFAAALQHTGASQHSLTSTNSQDAKSAPAPLAPSAPAAPVEEVHHAPQPAAFDPKKYNRYGFEISPQEAKLRAEKTEAQRREERRHENERMVKWTEMYHNWDQWKGTAKLKERIRKGIPDSFRVSIYQLILGSQELALQPENRHVYQNLLNDTSLDHDVKQKDVEATIFRDLHRTLPTHVFFQPGNPGQQRLFNVLRAYSRYDRVLGYCQGLGMIVAVVLTYVTEEEAFWIMVALLKGERHMMRGLYLVGLPLTMQYIFVFEKLLLQFEPKVAARLVDVPTTSFTAKWFMCIFSGLPFECMLRIWDVYICEGPKVLFRVAIAIMRIFKKEILSMSDEEFQPFMKDVMPTRLDTELLLKTAFDLSISHLDLEKYSVEYEKQNPM